MSLWLLVLLVIFGLLLADWIRKRFFGLTSFPVASKLFPVLGNAALTSDITGLHEVMMNATHKEFPGQDFRMWVLNDEVVVLNNPESARTLSLARRGRGDDFKVIVPFAGGISGMDSGDRHTALRKFFAPFTNSMKMQSVQEPILKKHCEILKRLLEERAKSGEWFDIQALLENAMFDLATDLVMGFNPETILAQSKKLSEDWKLVNEWIMWRNLTAAMPYWNYKHLKTKGVLSFDAAVSRIFQTMHEYVTKCHSACVANPSKEPTSALEFYFLSEKEANCELSDEECVKHGLNFIWGSIDSTRSTLVYSTLLGSKNPSTLSTLRGELDRVVKGNYPDASQLTSDMPELQAYIAEVLRLNPAFALVPHELDEPITVANGRVIPKGHKVWTNIYYAQREPLFWGNDAEEFRPSRHLNVTVPNVAYTPFGYGSRRCPGERLGQFDVRYFLATMVKNFEFEVRDAEMAKVVMMGSLQLSEPLMVRVKARA